MYSSGINFEFQVHTYDKAEVCRMLNGTDILMTGSSLMRHLFVAFLTILKGDINYGSLRPNTKPGKKNTVDSQKFVQSKFCKFTENRFLWFLTSRIGHNMECQLYT